jgi:hypothetical protein
LQKEIPNKFNQPFKNNFETFIYIYIYYGFQPISTKIGVTFHGAFFKHLVFDIIFHKTSNGAKKIFYNKGGNTKPKIMKRL